MVTVVTGDELSLVSLLPAINLRQCRCYRQLIDHRCHGIDENPGVIAGVTYNGKQLIAGVTYTGKQLIAGVTYTGKQLIAGVVDTGNTANTKL
jgi:hypothetical protein